MRYVESIRSTGRLKSSILSWEEFTGEGDSPLAIELWKFEDVRHVLNSTPTKVVLYYKEDDSENLRIREERRGAKAGCSHYSTYAYAPPR